MNLTKHEEKLILEALEFYLVNQSFPDDEYFEMFKVLTERFENENPSN